MDDRARLDLWIVASWFLMDGAWLMDWTMLVHVFAVVAFLLFLVWISWFMTARNLFATMTEWSWLLMNIAWATDEVSVAKFYFFLGGVFLLLAAQAGESPVLRRLRSLWRADAVAD